MFNFNANPEYVPGGVQNFWVSAPTGASGDAIGMAAMNAGAAGSDNPPPPQSGIVSSVFGSGFFTKSTATTMVSGRKEEQSMINTTKAAVRSTKEYMFPAGGWKFIEPSDVLCLT